MQGLKLHVLQLRAICLAFADYETQCYSVKLSCKSRHVTNYPESYEDIKGSNLQVIASCIEHSTS